MIVGISGILEDAQGNRRSAGSGKDEAAKALVELGFVPVAIADVLKRFCAEVFGFTHEQLYGAEKDTESESRLFSSPRRLLMSLGDWVRFWNPNALIERTLRVHERLQEGECYYDRVSGLRYLSSVGDGALPKTNVVIPDCRCRLEKNSIQEAGGKVLRIKRTCETAPSLGGDSDHPTEVDLLGVPDSEFDAVVPNDGTVEELHQKMRQLVEDWT